MTAQSPPSYYGQPVQGQPPAYYPQAPAQPGAGLPVAYAQPQPQPYASQPAYGHAPAEPAAGQPLPPPKGPDDAIRRRNGYGGAGCALFCVVLGIAVIAGGVSAGRAAFAADPDRDFVALGPACNVTTTLYREEQRTEQQSTNSGTGSNRKTTRTVYRCVDVYAYKFAYGGKTYDTVETRTQRGPTGTCNATAGSRAAPKYAEGERVVCWKARAPGTLGRPYTCPTAECVKLDDPAEEARGAVRGVIAAGVIGAIFLLCALGSAVYGYLTLKAVGRAGGAA
jgi:hypothetical protein